MVCLVRTGGTVYNQTFKYTLILRITSFILQVPILSLDWIQYLLELSETFLIFCEKEFENIVTLEAKCSCL